MEPPAVTSQGEAESPVCLRSRVKRAAEEAPNASQRLISGCRGGLEPQTHAPAAISTLRTAAEAAFFICRRENLLKGKCGRISKLGMMARFCLTMFAVVTGADKPLGKAPCFHPGFC